MIEVTINGHTDQSDEQKAHLRLEQKPDGFVEFEIWNDSTESEGHKFTSIELPADVVHRVLSLLSEVK